MYEVPDDTYCYPGTTILINKLNLRRQSRLDAFEAEMTAQRATEPFPTGKLDYAHYRAIHHHLFRDVYSWAGKPRTVRISKGGNMFCYPDHIDAQMTKLFGKLAAQGHLRGFSAEKFTNEVAHFLTELNAIHPFREGNGRTQLSFLTLLAEKAGHPLDHTRMNPGEVIEAMIESFDGDEEHLAAMLAKLI